MAKYRRDPVVHIMHMQHVSTVYAGIFNSDLKQYVFDDVHVDALYMYLMHMHNTCIYVPDLYACDVCMQAPYENKQTPPAGPG